MSGHQCTWIRVNQKCLKTTERVTRLMRFQFVVQLPTFALRHVYVHMCTITIIQYFI